MAIDVDRDDLISLRKAAESIPTKPSPSTLQRWRLYGVRGRKLETVLIGGLRYTSKQALTRFLSAPENIPPASPRQKSPSRTRQARKDGTNRG